MNIDLLSCYYRKVLTPNLFDWLHAAKREVTPNIDIVTYTGAIDKAIKFPVSSVFNKLFSNVSDSDYDFYNKSVYNKEGFGAWIRFEQSVINQNIFRRYDNVSLGCDFITLKTDSTGRLCGTIYPSRDTKLLAENVSSSFTINSVLQTGKWYYIHMWGSSLTFSFGFCDENGVKKTGTIPYTSYSIYRNYTPELAFGGKSWCNIIFTPTDTAWTNKDTLVSSSSPYSNPCQVLSDFTFVNSSIAFTDGPKVGGKTVSTPVKNLF